MLHFFGTIKPDYDHILGIAVLIGVFFMARLVRKLVCVLSKNSRFEKHILTTAFIQSIGNSITPFLISLTFYILHKLGITFGINEVAYEKTINVLTTVCIGVWAYYLVELPSYWYEYQSQKGSNPTNKMLAPLIKQIFRIFVIALVLASIYQTITDNPITPVLASLGIAGAALALAAQDTFKNFFGSFVLAGDKPFEIGERIVVEGHDGVVDSIGMRSTRIRTLDDHLVTIPNGHLANINIQNIGKRNSIKRVFTISLTYDTHPDKMQEALDILKQIFDNHEGMNEDFPPRIYFKDFAASSLDIMVIYWYFPADYWAYMGFSQKINMEILHKFNNAELDFAFPTQTIHLNNTD